MICLFWHRGPHEDVLGRGLVFISLLAQQVADEPLLPPSSRAEFERLTEMSSALLAHGDYHVHSASREALQADLRAHASGIPSQAPAPPSPSRHPAAAASPPAAAASGAAAAPGRDAQGWRAFAARIEVPPRESHAAAAAEADNVEAAAGEASALRAAAAAEAEAPQQPADPEEDIFAGVGSDTAWQAPGKAEPQETAAGGGSASDDQSEDGDDPMAALERAALAQGETAPHASGASSAALGGSPVPRSPHCGQRHVHKQGHGHSVGGQQRCMPGARAAGAQHLAVVGQP